MLYSVGAWS